MDKLPDDQHMIMSHFLEVTYSKRDAFVHPNEFGTGDAVYALIDAGYVEHLPGMNSENYIILRDKGEEYRRQWLPTQEELIEDLRNENTKLRGQVKELMGLMYEGMMRIRTADDYSYKYDLEWVDRAADLILEVEGKKK